MMTRDIGDSFIYILRLLFQGVQFCYSFLASIEFLGTNLLSFTVSIVVLGVVFSIIFAVVNGSTVYNFQRGVSKRGSKK